MPIWLIKWIVVISFALFFGVSLGLIAGILSKGWLAVSLLGLGVHIVFSARLQDRGVDHPIWPAF